ncbi:AAA family ATPase [Pseudomonas sp. NUPR-001]|uniref:AAA family ATPase n=1 Tax=Pseudomonas sp. NUPR-001 TaxID=3416058 RepID=UPI003F98D8E1
MRGPGLTSSGSISLISSAASGLLEKLKTRNSLDRLKPVFKVLGFEPNLDFVFKPMFKNPYHEESYEYDYEKVVHDTGPVFYGLQESLGIAIDPRLSNQILNLPEYAMEEIRFALSIYTDFFFDRPHFTLSVNYDYTWEYTFNRHHHNDRQLLSAVLLLLNYGLIKLMDLRLSKPSNPNLSLRRASSGEQCMLVIMLGIAGHISDYSKIFIDEPEISLHPQWQEKFMSLLIDVFESYEGCNFYIATHSPQILSKLSSKNCFITSLTRKEIYNSSEFRERSADYQLAEIFDAPGSMNEYIVRIAFKLMSSLRANERLSNENILDINKLSNFSKLLSESDPLHQLIVSALDMGEYYAAN